MGGRDVLHDDQGQALAEVVDLGGKSAGGREEEK